MNSSVFGVTGVGLALAVLVAMSCVALRCFLFPVGLSSRGYFHGVFSEVRSGHSSTGTAINKHMEDSDDWKA